MRRLSYKKSIQVKGWKNTKKLEVVRVGVSFNLIRIHQLVLNDIRYEIELHLCPSEVLPKVFHVDWELIVQYHHIQQVLHPKKCLIGWLHAYFAIERLIIYCYNFIDMNVVMMKLRTRHRMHTIAKYLIAFFSIFENSGYYLLRYVNPWAYCLSSFP